jgi:hypothetical protein
MEAAVDLDLGLRVWARIAVEPRDGAGPVAAVRPRLLVGEESGQRLPRVGGDAHLDRQYSADLRGVDVLAMASGELPDTVPATLAASLAVISLTAPVAWTLSHRADDLDELSRVLLDQWYAGMTSTVRTSEGPAPP